MARTAVAEHNGFDESGPTEIVYVVERCARINEDLDDTVMTKKGVSLLIDAMSYQYLVGAEIDYKEDLQGAQFVIKNPNATSTCGCGSSFSA